MPESYLRLKRSIIGDEANQAALRRSWASLSKRLATLADEVDQRQQAVRLSLPYTFTYRICSKLTKGQCIPEIQYDELVNSPSKGTLDRIKECGTVVVRGVVSEDQVGGHSDTQMGEGLGRISSRVLGE